MNDGLLRTTLTANAVLSGAAGLAAAALAGVLTEPLGIPAPLLVVVGLALVPWSTMLWWARSRTVLLRRDVVTAIAGDMAWVAGSAAVLALSPGNLTVAGHWVIGIMALGVADFAVLQAVGLRRMTTGEAVRSTPTGPRPTAP